MLLSSPYAKPCNQNVHIRQSANPEDAAKLPRLPGRLLRKHALRFVRNVLEAGAPANRLVVLKECLPPSALPHEVAPILVDLLDADHIRVLDQDVQVGREFPLEGGLRRPHETVRLYGPDVVGRQSHCVLR